MTKPKKKNKKKPERIPKGSKEMARAADSPPEGSKAEEVLNRQKKVEGLKIKGFTHDQISEMLGVSVGTIESDVREIRKRNAAIYRGDTDVDEHAAMILSRYEKAQAELWTAHSQMVKGQESIQVQAISAVVITLRDQVKLLQALGRLPKDVDPDKNTAPVNVYFNIKRPDRTKQLAEQAKKNANDKKE